MRKSVWLFCIVFEVAGLGTASAQVIGFKIIVSEVYKTYCDDGTTPCSSVADCTDGSVCNQFVALCSGDCGQCVGDGAQCTVDSDCEGHGTPATCEVNITEPADYINLEIIVEGWDSDPDQGICGADETTPCSISAPDCPGGATCNPWPLVGTSQWTMDSSGYWNGGYGPGLIPAADCTNDGLVCGEIRCSGTGPDPDEECWCAYDPVCSVTAQNLCTCGGSSGATCSGQVCSKKAAVYINRGRADYIFAPFAPISAFNLNSLDYQVGASVMGGGGAAEFDDGPPPRSSPYYLGTILLQVTDDGCGPFTLDLRQNRDAGNHPSDTFLNDSTGVGMLTPIVEPRTINLAEQTCNPLCNRPPPQCMRDRCHPCDGVCEFVPDDGATCIDGDDCTENDTCVGDVCVGTPMECPPGYECISGDCLVVCGWDDFLGTDPPHCAIDARQPHDPWSTDPPQGWKRLALLFSCDTSGLALSIDPNDFTRRTVPIGPVPPRIQAAYADLDDANTLILKLYEWTPIPPGYYSCYKYTPTDTEWCMGYLPGDSSQNGAVQAGDIDALIACINSGTCEEWQSDIDRDGATTVRDVVREIDVLNGSNEFDPWIGESLGRCPLPL